VAIGISQAFSLTNAINVAFVNGQLSAFAQANLVAAPSCPDACSIPGAPGCGW
jgi:hypothetical protein